MKRTVLVLALLVLSMGAGTLLLDLIERRTQTTPRDRSAPHTIVATNLGAAVDPLR